MSEKQFCGNAKEITTKFGKLLKVSFSEKDLETLKANLKNRWVHTVVKEKREKVEGKPTHYLEIDTFEPKPQGTPTTSVGQSEDLPF